MKLNRLTDGLRVRVTHGDGEAMLTDLVDDSRRATPGCAFLARSGSGDDGRRYIADALRRGAAAVLEVEQDDPRTIGRLAERFFGDPAGRLRLIAVTGTNGKSTTCFLIQHLLHAAGVRCGLLGTVVIDDGVERRPAELTTPGSIDFSRMLARMASNGCTAAACELSSHALHQGRAAALRFDVAVFTNLTGDHLDYHGTMDAYADAKAKLFESLDERAWAIVNADDPYALRMVRDCRARVCWTRTGGMADSRWPMAEGLLQSAEGETQRQEQAQPPRADANRTPHVADDDPSAIHHPPSAIARIHHLAADHSRATFTGPWGAVEAALPLVGRHNVANALQAIAAAHCITDLSRVLPQALPACPQVPGRLQRVDVMADGGWRMTDGLLQSPEGESKREEQTQPPRADANMTPHVADNDPAARRPPPAAIAPTVLVDYAHTHDSLENVLSALRPIVDAQGGRLICVFGCGGDRDRTKRPKMARAAVRFADQVIITSDNPRTEDPTAIIRDIVGGMADGGLRRAERLLQSIEGETQRQEQTQPQGADDHIASHVADDDPSALRPPPSAIAPSAIASVFVEPDRAAAIRRAIAGATARDTVLLAGKGHEDYQIIADRSAPGGTRKIHFDDREHAAQALRAWAADARTRPAARTAGDFWTPRHLAHVAGGTWLSEPADLDAPLAGVSIDTRTLAPGQVFFAVPGERFDGHDFVEEALGKGAAFAVVSRADPPKRATPVLLVRDTVWALQALASAWRDVLAEHGCRVIAVTGSSGKTTTRQLIAHVLAGRFAGTQSPRSFNNHLGVPLTLLAAGCDDDFVVAEAGTNHPGEIAALGAILRPDAAVITTLGEAHIGNFGSREAIAKEKRSLYEFVRPGGLKVEPDLPPQAAMVERLSLPGEHMKRNAQAAVVVARWMGMPDDQIIERLADAPAVDGRLQTLRFGPVTVIHDAYNANPDSVRAAIALLFEKHGEAARRVLVLSDMLELGAFSAEAHQRVGALFRAQRQPGDVLITIGPESKRAGGEHGFDAWTDDLPARVAAMLASGDVVLLKASRGMKLERLLPAIEQRFGPRPT